MKKALIILAALTVLSFAWAIFLMMKFYMAINEPKQEYKEGSVVVLGESSSMRLATPEDIDKDTLGMIVFNDTSIDTPYYKDLGDSIEILRSGYYRIEFIGTPYDTTTIHLSDSALTVRGLVK